MIKVLDHGDVCGCGRTTLLLVDELGRTAHACFGCTGRLLPPKEQAELQELRKLAQQPRRIVRARRTSEVPPRFYSLRECTRCHRLYQPTGARGTTCPGDVCPP